MERRSPLSLRASRSGCSSAYFFLTTGSNLLPNSTAWTPETSGGSYAPTFSAQTS